MGLTLYFILLISLLVSAPRPHLKASVPEGFARAKTRGTYQAVSPEGMRYRVRAVRNEPSQAIEFWGDALKNHLLAEGYRLSNPGQPFTAGKRAGILYEWLLPYGSEDHIYLTALVVSGRRILVAEAAAQHTVYGKYRTAVIESLKTLRPR